MTSDYNGVLNNNASKTNRCPEKPYNSDKTFLAKTSKHNRYTQPPLKTTINYNEKEGSENNSLFYKI